MLLLILVSATAAWACWWAGNEIASPQRRPLQDYHADFLAHPAAHGVVVTPFTLTDQTPCLLVAPQPGGLAGHRGEMIRRQLMEKGLVLPPFGEARGTLVLVHGRRGRKEDYLPIAERLCAVGFRCVLCDMPAHGDHPTATCTYGLLEREIPGRTLAEAAAQFGFPAAPAGLLGMSMGGAVATQAAGVPGAEWKALVVISSFDRLQTAIQKNVEDRAGSLLAGAWIGGAAQVFRWKTGRMLTDICSDAAAARVKAPTLMAHGTADEVVPIASGKALFAALPAGLETRWVDVPDARHDNVLVTDFPIYATVAEWMLGHVR